MEIPIYQIDAFTKERFKGNPAAICPLEEWLSEELMQNIAAENNLSETAFFVKKNDRYQIRWFTPENEIDLCGHATLASAHLIMRYLEKGLERVVFHSKSGKLEVYKNEDRLSMIFPSRPAEVCDVPEDLVKALGVEPEQVLKSRDYMVIYSDEGIIKDIQPDMELLKKVNNHGTIITAKGKEVDFVSRFFVPACGVPEDPVTGSAHCTLIPYWSSKLAKKDLVAKQLSARGGTLYCQDMGDRVKISGSAVLYLRGSIEV